MWCKHTNGVRLIWWTAGGGKAPSRAPCRCVCGWQDCMPQLARQNRAKETKLSLNKASLPQYCLQKKTTACRTLHRRSKACCDLCPAAACLRNHCLQSTLQNSLLEAQSVLTAINARDGAICNYIWTHSRSQQLRDRYACIPGLIDPYLCAAE